MFNIKLDESKKESSSSKPSAQKNKKEFFAKKKPKKVDDGEVIADREKTYKQILSGISGSLKAVLLDDEIKEIEKIPVRELTDEIKKGDKIFAVVFDGIITQRLLDIANNKNVKEIVGIKLGNVGKMPKSVKVLTKSDFS
jgi:hypothetical protein